MTTIKATQRTVEFPGGIKIDGFKLPDGSFRTSITSASTALDRSENWLYSIMTSQNKILADLIESGFSNQIILVDVLHCSNEIRQYETISLDDLGILLLYASLQGEPKALLLQNRFANHALTNSLPIEQVTLPGYTFKNKKVVKQLVPKKRQLQMLERECQYSLLASLGGQVEVLTPAGKIDLLTSTHLIEVKRAVSWKAALGQVLSYGYFYPSHILRVHLIGSVHSKSKEEIENVCRKFNVEVTWEELRDDLMNDNE